MGMGVGVGFRDITNATNCVFTLLKIYVIELLGCALEYVTKYDTTKK